MIGLKPNTQIDPVILVYGGTGVLGQELLQSLQTVGRIASPTRFECDIGDFQAVNSTIRAVRPHIVVNAAAYTAVDQAESNRDDAYRVNFHAVENIARAAAAVDCPVVHFSTDYVFDGKQTAPYSENDATAPLNVYGASKLAGDLALVHTTHRHLILRISWLYGRNGAGFVNTILNLAATRSSLGVVADQIGAPTAAGRVADATTAIVANCLNAIQASNIDSFKFGVFNLCASGVTSRLEYARAILGRAAARGVPLQVDASNITPMKTAALSGLAARPLNSQLCCQKLAFAFDIRLPHWQIDLDRAIDAAAHRRL